MGKPPSSTLGRTSQTKKLSKLNLSKLLSKTAIPLFVLLLTLACGLGNLQAKNMENFLEEDSSIFISLVRPREELETVKSTSSHTQPQQNKLFALASVAPPLGQTSFDTTFSLALSDGSTLTKTNAPKCLNLENLSHDKIITYEVKGGETISTIAAKFGISQNVIFWANEGLLKYADSVIKPGDTLKILPVTGVTHQVKNGESLEAIAQKYKADLDQTLAYNKLINPSDIEEGQVLIMPGGKKAEPKLKPKPRNTYFASNTSSGRYYSTSSYSSSGKHYNGGGGWCTNYVKSKKHIPWRGNAGTWLSGAKASGFEIGNTPKAGAVIVTNESWWGHVGIVESVNSDGSITISERNYKGYGIDSKRTLSPNSGRVKGYIY